MKTDNKTTNILIQKAINSLKCGFCVIIDDFIFFATYSVDESFLAKNINKNPSFCYTRQFYDFNIKKFYPSSLTYSENEQREGQFNEVSKSSNEILNSSGVYTKNYELFAEASKAQNAALKLCIYAELLPSVICFNKLDADFVDLFSPEIITSQQINNFENTRFHDLEYLTHAKVANEASDDSFLYVFSSKTSGQMHYAITVNYKKTDDKSANIRVHSSCYTGDLMHSLRCDCKYQLHNAMKVLAKKQNGGIIIYLMQEGRGIGLANKVSAYNFQQSKMANPFVKDLEIFYNITKNSNVANIVAAAKQDKYTNLDTVESNNVIGLDDDYRNMLPAKKILDFFDINSVNLITNNPLKSNYLASFGIKILSVINVVSPQNIYNKSYLKTKYLKMNHRGIINFWSSCFAKVCSLFKVKSLKKYTCSSCGKIDNEKDDLSKNP